MELSDPLNIHFTRAVSREKKGIYFMRRLVPLALNIFDWKTEKSTRITETLT